MTGVQTCALPIYPEDPLRSEGQVMTVPFKVLAASGEAEIEIEDYTFGPSTLTIRVGTTVRWSKVGTSPTT